MFQKCSDNKKFLDKRGIRILSIFWNQCPKTSWGYPFLFQKNLGIEKLYAQLLYHDFLLKVFCLTVPQKLRGGTLLCFRNVPITKSFWIVGVSGFCLDFLSHSAKKIRGGTLMGFRNVLVSKIFWIRGVSGFCLFLESVPKNFLGERFHVSEMF